MHTRLQVAFSLSLTDLPVRTILQQLCELELKLRLHSNLCVCVISGLQLELHVYT